MDRNRPNETNRTEMDQDGPNKLMWIKLDQNELNGPK